MPVYERVSLDRDTGDLSAGHYHGSWLRTIGFAVDANDPAAEDKGFRFQDIALIGRLIVPAVDSNDLRVRSIASSDRLAPSSVCARDTRVGTRRSSVGAREFAVCAGGVSDDARGFAVRAVASLDQLILCSAEHNDFG
jgi:hypothetical protein